MALTPVPGEPTAPDVLSLPLDAARERLAAAGLPIGFIAETTAWRPQPPDGAEWRVVRQRVDAAGAALLVVAPFRPPAGSGVGSPGGDGEVRGDGEVPAAGQPAGERP